MFSTKEDALHIEQIHNTLVVKYKYLLIFEDKSYQ